MTRRWWFFGLPVAAQVAQFDTLPPNCSVDNKGDVVCTSESPPTAMTRACSLPTRCKPANGECPVCGTVAESYIRYKHTYIGPSNDRIEWQIKHNITLDKSNSFYPDPEHRTVTCAYCRVRFEQKAEN